MMVSDMDKFFADLCEVIPELQNEMNRTGWPNVTPNTGSLYCHGQVYTQQRKMVNNPPSSYDQFYQNQIPVQWIKPNITAGYVNEQYVGNTKYMPEALSNEYFQSGRNGQGDLWKQAQQMAKSNTFRKCMCSCTSGVPQCTCDFSRQQEKLKPSLEQNSLQWLGESSSTQHNQIDTSNPHQSFTVPFSTYGYPYFPDYSDNIGCPQKPAARSASLSNNTPPVLSSVPVKPPLLSTRDQIQSDISSPHYDSSQVEIHSPTYNQFPKTERTSLPQCKSSQVNPPNPKTRRKRPRLCHFLLELLANPQQYSSIVEWVDQENGVFKFLNSSEVASQWGKRRDKPNMKYENFARSLRTYIAKGIMTKPRSRLVYRFTNKVL